MRLHVSHGFFLLLFCYVNHRPIAKEKEKHATREGLEAGYPEPSRKQKVRAVAYVCDSYCTFVASFFSLLLSCLLSFFLSLTVTDPCFSFLSSAARLGGVALPCFATVSVDPFALRCVALRVVMLW